MWELCLLEMRRDLALSTPWEWEGTYAYMCRHKNPPLSMPHRLVYSLRVVGILCLSSKTFHSPPYMTEKSKKKKKFLSNKKLVDTKMHLMSIKWFLVVLCSSHLGISFMFKPTILHMQYFLLHTYNMCIYIYIYMYVCICDKREVRTCKWQPKWTTKEKLRGSRLQTWNRSLLMCRVMPGARCITRVRAHTRWSQGGQDSDKCSRPRVFVYYMV